MDWIDKYGNLFSLIGLIITVITFYNVLRNKKILGGLNTKNFKLNRMPENISDLKNLSEYLSELLSDYDSNKKELKGELCKIQPILKSLSKSLVHEEMENLLILKRSLKNIDNWTYEGVKKSWYEKGFIKQKEMSESMVIEIDIKLNRLITDLENIGRDNNKNLL